MADQAVIERRGVGGLQNRGCGGRDIAVDQYGDLFHPRGENSTCHRSNLAAAEPAQNFERIGQMLAMEGNRLLHGSHFACKNVTFRTGTGTNQSSASPP